MEVVLATLVFQPLCGRDGGLEVSEGLSDGLAVGIMEVGQQRGRITVERGSEIISEGDLRSAPSVSILEDKIPPNDRPSFAGGGSLGGDEIADGLGGVSISRT